MLYWLLSAGLILYRNDIVACLVGRMDVFCLLLGEVISNRFLKQTYLSLKFIPFYTLY